ncbi:MarR family winged helix-turn-helix transcriptional regulator [Actinoplanes subglobosus]|uniref:MarR family winged helix-turn-helix transcriptional regulator n=1 Tax=Actinoplanes subglobosus TaxID=1547892 RepID=A0ABV8IP08_9ACTN
MNDEAEFSADERIAWMTLAALMVTLPTAIDAQLKRDAGMNLFEYGILAALADAPEDAVQMTRLADLIAGSVSRLSHAVTRLERHGWAQRRTHHHGPRRTEVALTETGRELLAQVTPLHVREVRRLVLDALTTDQVNQLRHLCDQMLPTVAPGLPALLAATLRTT